MRQPQSPTLPLDPDGPGRRDSEGYRRAAGDPLSQFRNSRSFCNAPDLSQEIVGQGQAFEGRTGFQLAVQIVRNVSELDHLGHVTRIAACG